MVPNPIINDNITAEYCFSGIGIDDPFYLAGAVFSKFPVFIVVIRHDDHIAGRGSLNPGRNSDSFIVI